MFSACPKRAPAIALPPRTKAADVSYSNSSSFDLKQFFALLMKMLSKNQRDTLTIAQKTGNM